MPLLRKRLFSRAHPSRRPLARVLLRLEELETRALPSAWVAQPNLYLTAVAPPSDNPVAPLAGTANVITYTPAQIRHAYGFDQVTLSNGKTADGSGQTIAIVDAFDDPNIAADLTAFNQAFGLQQFNTAGGPTFTKVNENGGTAPPAADAGWAGEIALDVEWAHAIAPRANILLVEASTAYDADLLAAIDYARNQPGVVTVSMSWGGPEFAAETSSAYEPYFTTPAGHTGVTFVAAAGDSGAASGPEWPAASPNVLAVGGTTLHVNSRSEYYNEIGWSSGGGGNSAFEAEPAFQTAVQHTGVRSNPDVAYDADPYTGFYVYDSYADTSGQTGWFSYGGTSAGAPQWAALLALADQGRALAGKGSLAGGQAVVYALPAGDFHDIVSGNNGQWARGGYDLITGRGSPLANLVVRDLIGAANGPTAVSTGATVKTNGSTSTTHAIAAAAEVAAGPNAADLVWTDADLTALLRAPTPVLAVEVPRTVPVAAVMPVRETENAVAEPSRMVGRWDDRDPGGAGGETTEGDEPWEVIAAG